jgi:hypothetical protein
MSKNREMLPISAARENGGGLTAVAGRKMDADERFNATCERVQIATANHPTAARIRKL